MTPIIFKAALALCINLYNTCTCKRNFKYQVLVYNKKFAHEMLIIALY